MAHRPFCEHGPLATARVDLDRNEVSGHSHLVKADASHTPYLTIHTRVVMAEKAHKRSQAIDQSVKPRGRTYPIAAAILLDRNPCRCVVDQKDVHRAVQAEGIDLIAGIVALRITLELFRRALEV